MTLSGTNMKKHLLAIAVLGMVPYSATAADLAARPVYKAAPASVPFVYWNKCYIGVSGGYITAGRDRTTTLTANDADLALSQVLGNVPYTLSSDPDGGIVGGTAGCNWNTGSIVLGGETDLSWTSQRATTATTLGAFAVATTYTEELQALGTVRGRLGFAAGPTLFYATGGLAYGYLKESASIIPGPAGILLGGAQLAGAQSQWRVGWTVGAGIEHMFSPNWSLKGEYLYYDLGRSSLLVTTFAGGPVTENGTFSHSNNGHIVRVGVNYHFGIP
jgi:outer membrane immunogenic protein